MVHCLRKGEHITWRYYIPGKGIHTKGLKLILRIKPSGYPNPYYYLLPSGIKFHTWTWRFYSESIIIYSFFSWTFFFPLWFTRSCWRRGSGWRWTGSECRLNSSTSGSVWRCLLCSYTEVTIRGRPRGDPSHLAHSRLGIWAASTQLLTWDWEPRAALKAEGEEENRMKIKLSSLHNRRVDCTHARSCTGLTLGQLQWNTGWHWERPSSSPALDFCVLEITNSKSYNQKNKSPSCCRTAEWGRLTEHMVKTHMLELTSFFHVAWPALQRELLLTLWCMRTGRFVSYW